MKKETHQNVKYNHANANQKLSASFIEMRTPLISHLDLSPIDIHLYLNVTYKYKLPLVVNIKPFTKKTQSAQK